MEPNAAARLVRKHLTPPVALARAVVRAAGPSEATGAHRSTGNGVRVHAIWFAALSLAALLAVLAAAALATLR